MTISVVMEADPEDVSEVVRFPEDAIVTVVVLPEMLLELVMNLEDAVEAVTLPKTKVVIANEADDTVQAVDDSEFVDLRPPRLYVKGLVFPRDMPKVILLLKSART